MALDAVDVLCAQLTCDLFAIAKFLVLLMMISRLLLMLQFIFKNILFVVLNYNV